MRKNVAKNRKTREGCDKQRFERPPLTYCYNNTNQLR